MCILVANKYLWASEKMKEKHLKCVFAEKHFQQNKI